MNRRFLEDLGERVGTTYVCSFAGLLIAGGRHWHTMSHIETAAVSALAAAFMTAKGLLARRVGDPNTAGLLPALPAAAVVPKEPPHGGQ